MKNLILGVLIVGCLTAAVVIFIRNNSEPEVIFPARPSNDPDVAGRTPPPDAGPLADDFVPDLPKRTYPAPIAIAEADLPAKVTSLVLALNVLDNEDRRTTGEDLAALPAAAVPLMRKTLERDDLSWVAIAALGKAIELIERRESGKQMTDDDAARLAWVRDTMVGQYKRAGHRTAAWDKEVIEALELWALIVADAPTQHMGLHPRIRSLLESALNKGCQDALAWYCLMTMYENMSTMPDGAFRRDEARGFLDAAKRMKESKYSHNRKAWSFIKAARMLHTLAAAKAKTPAKRMPVAADATEWHDLGFAELKLAFEEETMIEGDALNLVTYYLGACAELGNGRPAALERITPLVEKAFPGGGAMASIRGEYFIDWAWDARGSGWANTVNEEDWPKFQERLEKARVLLTEETAKHPKRADLPAKLVKVLMVTDGDMDLVEKYLKQAVRNNPNDTAASGAILGFLQPKWGGSWPAAMRFARQCLLTGNWEGGAAEQLLSMHVQASMSIAQIKTDEDSYHNLAYFKNPEVFKDVELVCVNRLKWFPGDRSALCNLAIAASGAEKWELANGVFDQLGDVADYRFFRGHKAYIAMRTKAQNHAVKPIAINPAMTANDEKLRELLVKTRWHLDYFSPGAGIRRRGEWNFTADARMSDGHQPNWKVENGILETYSDDRSTLNRWVFDADSGRWQNLTNAPANDGKGAFILPIGTK